MAKQSLAEKLVTAPFDEQLPAQERKDTCLKLSEVMTRVATSIVCHTLVDHASMLDDERLSIAHAFLQRVTSTHLCNHKMTAEGLVYEFNGEQFELPEEYKTMTLTRSVYEHLAMFYFLFEHPKSQEERDTAWRLWKRNGHIEIPTGDGSSERLPYSQAWKYLFRNKEVSALYSHLSMHCHPVYDGLRQYQTQSPSDGDNDWVPLYLSCCFVAYLCKLFLKELGRRGVRKRLDLGQRDQEVFNALSLVLQTSK
jgi:hypothetical protein